MLHQKHPCHRTNRQYISRLRPVTCLCLGDTAPPLGTLRDLPALKDLFSIPLASLLLWSWSLCAAPGNYWLLSLQPLLNTLTPWALSRSSLPPPWPPSGGLGPPSSSATNFETPTTAEIFHCSWCRSFTCTLALICISLLHSAMHFHNIFRNLTHLRVTSSHVKEASCSEITGWAWHPASRHGWINFISYKHLGLNQD